MTTSSYAESSINYSPTTRSPGYSRTGSSKSGSSKSGSSRFIPTSSKSRSTQQFDATSTSVVTFADDEVSGDTELSSRRIRVEIEDYDDVEDTPTLAAIREAPNIVRHKSKREKSFFERMCCCCCGEDSDYEGHDHHDDDDDSDNSDEGLPVLIDSEDERNKDEKLSEIAKHNLMLPTLMDDAPRRDEIIQITEEEFIIQNIDHVPDGLIHIEPVVPDVPKRLGFADTTDKNYLTKQPHKAQKVRGNSTEMTTEETSPSRYGSTASSSSLPQSPDSNSEDDSY